MHAHEKSAKTFCCKSFYQALAAINTQNGTDLGGRRILVREDREDRDVKQYSPEGAAPPPARPPKAAGRGGAGRGAGRAPGRGAGRGAGRAPPVEREENSSGLQIVVQGIPWSYTWKEVKDMFAEVGDIERADVAMGNDGRSRVGDCLLTGYICVQIYHLQVI
jgi:RNA recognition motif-containing protein